MPKTQLRDELIAMVNRHGMHQVEQQLKELATAKATIRTTRGTVAKSRYLTKRRSSKVRPKLTATQYVSKMEMPLEKRGHVSELAARFENKTFLPAFGDIVNFCHNYGIKAPASRSRVNAIPRVFKLLATLETDQIQRIVDGWHFSGPSRLGPIADAIRRNGRAAGVAKRR